MGLSIPGDRTHVDTSLDQRLLRLCLVIHIVRICKVRQPCLHSQEGVHVLFVFVCVLREPSLLLLPLLHRHSINNDTSLAQHAQPSVAVDPLIRVRGRVKRATLYMVPLRLIKDRKRCTEFRT